MTPEQTLEKVRQHLLNLPDKPYDVRTEPNRFHWYKVCHLCGGLTWNGSRPLENGEEPTFSIEGFQVCRGCEEMTHHFPDVVKWVDKVVEFLRFTLEAP